MDVLINLCAFLLPLILFTAWGLIGYATLSLLRSQRNSLQNALLAPVIGFAITLVPVFTLSRLGLPAQSFASPLALLLAALTALTLWKRKPVFSAKAYFPFAIIFFVSLLLIGRPLLLFGFDWVSYSNDDMANYSLAAFRILKHGFFDIPSVNALTQGKDYSLFYWFMHVPGMVRPGCEMLLAFISGVTHLSPLEIFMPTILAFHLTLISTTGALVCTAKRKNAIAIVACLLLAFSALTVLGTLYQLIAQVAGLSLLIASVILIFQPFTLQQKYGALLQGILIGIMVMALLVTYPELVPFFGLGMMLYFTLLIFKGWRSNRTFWIAFAVAFVTSCILLNTHLIAALQFMLVQIGYGASVTLKEIQAAIFPYYLLPSGIANLWGLQTMSLYPKEPRMSFTILLGAFLTLTVICLTLRLFFLRATNFTCIVIAMLAVAINLFINDFGFGMFKLAMFLQPFFAAVIAISLFELVKDNFKKTLAVLLLILGGLSSVTYYVTRSKAITPGGFSEIVFASSTKMNKEFYRGIKNLPADVIILSDDFNVSLIKFMSLKAQGKKFSTLVSPIFFLGYFVAQEDIKSNFLEDLSDKYFFRKLSLEITEKYLNSQYHLSAFIVPNEPNKTLDFLQFNSDIDAAIYNKNSVLAADSNLRTIINRRRYSERPPQNFSFEPYHQIKNHLVFIDSKQGAAYNSLLQAKDIKPTPAFFNLEQDGMYRERTMQALGRHLLFRVLNPTEKFRVALNITNTLDGNSNNSLPKAVAMGNEAAPFPIIGRGSARVFSDPITPQLVGNIPYIAIDMNKEGRRFTSNRQGLMRLFGSKITLDLRRIVTFGRDISLITEEEYQQLKAPTELKQFPKDFTNLALAYSGFYEDGWVSDEAYVQLSQPHPHQSLVIRGMVPKRTADFVASDFTLLVDGKAILHKTLQPGAFELKEAIPQSDKLLRKIELRFSQLQLLPGEDGRPVAAKINYIGFSG